MVYHMSSLNICFRNSVVDITIKRSQIVGPKVPLESKIMNEEVHALMSNDPALSIRMLESLFIE